MLVFDDLGVPGKLTMSSSGCHKSREKSSLACEIQLCEQRLPECFSLTESHFLIKISA